MDPVLLGLTISLSAVGAWFIVSFRMAASLYHRHERHISMVVMPFIGLLASIGMLASTVHTGQLTGELDLMLSGTMLTFLTSMGRGALLMGGIIVLFRCHPGEE